MTGILPATTQRVLQLLADGKRRPDIEDLLIAEGHDEYLIRNLVAEAVRLHNARARSRALTLILTGGALCFASFFITLVLAYSGTGSGFILYGLTSIGILFVFAGFVKIF